jgi:SAM-dependent methyltransferase
MQKPPSYYGGLNLKLLDAIPSGAKRVLELGCANGRLGESYKAHNPGTYWCGVDRSSASLEAAELVLDTVHAVDLDRDSLGVLGGDFDVIVMGDVLEHLSSPEQLLEALHACTSAQARIVACVPNAGHWSVQQRLLGGDLCYDDSGLLDRTHLRLYTPASLFKTLLDTGWLPDLYDAYMVPPPESVWMQQAVAASMALGASEETAARQLALYQMVITCTKWDMQALQAPGPGAPFSVIVPVNQPWQYQLNLARSPGLREVNAEIVVVQQAPNAATAFEQGRARARHAWCVMAHQDVYFPTGSGWALGRQLQALETAGAHREPVGFLPACVRSDATLKSFGTPGW